MSTRGVYTFTDGDDTVHVYKHSDNYPDGPYGALAAIEAATKFAWELPRFEANEFAAAFVAANKECPGNVRLCAVGITEPYMLAANADYHYIVTSQGSNLQVTVNAVEWWGEPSSETLYAGSLADAHVWATKRVMAANPSS